MCGAALLRGAGGAVLRTRNLIAAIDRFLIGVVVRGDAAEIWCTVWCGVWCGAAHYITKYLGMYIRNITKEQLDIRGGSISLDNVEVRTEALDFLQLPVTVKKGFVGKIRINLSWYVLDTIHTHHTPHTAIALHRN